MPLDAFCLAAVRAELSGRITGQKIDKVQQPERDIIILSLRGGDRAPCQLLLSAGTGDARAHLTEHRFEHPASPPMFCMLLRKHLTGARIIAVTQPQSERVLELTFETSDSMGIVEDKHMIIEMIGRLSNIILTEDDGLIIDCLRRISDDNMDRRAVLPGLYYNPPQAQEGKIDPLTVNAERWQELFDLSSVSASRSSMSESLACSFGINERSGQASLNAGTIDKWLMAGFTALSPLICRELSRRAYGEIDYRTSVVYDGGSALRREFFALMDIVKSSGFEPWVVVDGENTPKDFSYIRITQYEGVYSVLREENFSKMLDGYYTKTAQAARIKQRASATEKTVKTARDRLVRKLAAQVEELKKTADRETLRQSGDIITANIHLMKKGQTVLNAQDFYSEDGEQRTITLDPLKTPQQNAAKYYKDFTKAKTAEKILSQQIVLGQTELEYLESVLDELSLIESERDLNEIRLELSQSGYVKTHKKETTKEKAGDYAPMRFVSSTGATILAGRNNAQNDKLTLKTASKADVWLHAQKSHGAHVIIKYTDTRSGAGDVDRNATGAAGIHATEAAGGAETKPDTGTGTGAAPDETTLFEAAVIAAYYSAARGGGKTVVDYTLVRNVKKPQGGKPGMVIYTDYKTIIVVPDEELVIRLRRQE